MATRIIKEKMIDKLKEKHPDMTRKKLWQLWCSFNEIIIECLLEGFTIGLLYRDKVTILMTMNKLSPRNYLSPITKKLEKTGISIRVNTTIKRWFPAFLRESEWL